MKKTVLFILTFALILTVCAGALAEIIDQIDFPESGFTYDVPDSWGITIGQLLDGGTDRGETLGYDTGILLGTVIYTGRTDEELYSYLDFVNEIETKENLSEEDFAKIDEYYQRNLELFIVLGIRDDLTLEYACKTLTEVDNPFGQIVELGKKDEFTYYLGTMNLDVPQVANYIKDWPKEILDEYKALAADVIAHPERVTLKTRTVSFVPPAIGSVASFETADVNGNKVSSADLFAKNKVTLVNIWRTWCGPCVEEMPDFDEILKKYAGKGVGVVTYCADADNDELIALAKNITSGYGFDTLVYSESINSAFPWHCTPMTYFVDSEGKILGYPLEGKQVEKYSEILDAALKGDAESVAAAAPVSEKPAAGENATYVINVVDQNGDPVPKVAVGFCTESTCNFVKSDANGIITYEGAPYAYHVDIIKVPSGYSFNHLDEIYTDPRSMSMTLTITKD